MSCNQCCCGDDVNPDLSCEVDEIKRAVLRMERLALFCAFRTYEGALTQADMKRLRELEGE